MMFQANDSLQLKCPLLLKFEEAKHRGQNLIGLHLSPDLSPSNTFGMNLNDLTT